MQPCLIAAFSRGRNWRGAATAPAARPRAPHFARLGAFFAEKLGLPPGGGFEQSANIEQGCFAQAGAEGTLILLGLSYLERSPN